MKNYYNIERAMWTTGLYIGYGRGNWCIRRYGKNKTAWIAVCSTSPLEGNIYGRTLQDISVALAKRTGEQT